MRNRKNNAPLLIVGIIINLLAFLYFLSLFTYHSRLQEESASDNLEFSGISLRWSPKVLYLDKARYRIAIELTEDINNMEYTRGINEKGPSTESETGTVRDSRPTFTGNINTVNDYDEVDAKNEGDADEKIDQNSSWENPTKPHRSHRTCKRSPIRDIVLLKTHCTGGNTFANIFYRYGDLNELNFALPKHRSYEYFWPFHFHPSFVDANFLNSSSPNLLINARYSEETMKALMKNSFYVTVLRNPVDHFESVFHIHHISTLLGLQNSSDPLKEFLSNPRETVLKSLRSEPQLDISLNMVKNGQFFDLGLEHKFYDDMDTINRRISELADSIDLVLILEYFDESLVLLKRQLCWELDDMLYFRLNKGTMEYSSHTTDEQQTQMKVWNKADTTLYDYFNKTFWDKIRQQDSTYWEEVHELRRKVQNVEDECIFSKKMNPDSDDLYVRLRSDISSTNQYLCEKMKMTEEEYISYLKKKIDLKVTEQNKELRRMFPGKKALTTN